MKPHSYHHTEAIDRIARLIKILTIVKSRRPKQRFTRSDLADACSCHWRTIQRDIDILNEAEIPVVYDPSLRSYILRERDWVYPIVTLSVEDTLVLAVARTMLSTAGLPMQEALLATLDKVTVSLHPLLRPLIEQTNQVVKPGQMARDYSNAPLVELMNAASQNQTVEIDYESRSSSTRGWRSVDPYEVKLRNGQFWELNGWDHRKHAVITFALNRIFGVRSTTEGFQIREEEWRAFQNAKGVVGGIRSGEPIPVDVVFLAELAAYALDQQWADGLSIEKQADGSALLTGVAQGVEGIIPELLRWRRYCEVRGGSELRDRMAEEIREMSKIYEK